jgi:hypothetical protein
MNELDKEIKEEETSEEIKTSTEEQITEEDKPTSKPKSKGTDRFKETIKKYLDDRAGRDELFAVTYKKENK